jgi:hypothetical protein
MMLKARGLVQHGGPPGWQEESDSAGYDFLRDGRYMPPHRKKRFTSFPSPAGMSLTKLPLGRNNSVMTSLFPPRESLVVTSWLGTGNSRTFFYGVPCRAVSSAVAAAAQLRAVGISSCCYIVKVDFTQPSVMTSVTNGWQGPALHG